MKTYSVQHSILAWVDYTYETHANSKEEALENVRNGEFYEISGPDVDEIHNEEFVIEEVDIKAKA